MTGGHLVDSVPLADSAALAIGTNGVARGDRHEEASVGRPDSAASGSHKTLVSIQILRGLAALMVVIHHALTTGRHGLFWGQFQSLQGGVDIFFVISGVIMWVSAGSLPGTRPGKFLRDRVRRIVPLYWLCTMLLALAALTFPSLMKTTRVSWEFFLSSLFFWPTLHPFKHVYWPLLIPGWSLNLEMYFYVLFAASLWLGQRSQVLRVAAAFALFAASLALHFVLPESAGALRFLTDPMIIEFAVGVAIGVVYSSCGLICLYRWWFVSLAALATLIIIPNFIPAAPRTLGYGLPSMVAVGAAVFARPVNLAPLRRLGDVSYSLYLTHPMVLPLLERLFLWLRIDDPLLLFAMDLAVSIAVAFLTYRLVERPLDHFLRLGMARQCNPALRNPERI